MPVLRRQGYRWLGQRMMRVLGISRANKCTTQISKLRFFLCVFVLACSTLLLFTHFITLVPSQTGSQQNLFLEAELTILHRPISNVRNSKYVFSLSAPQPPRDVITFEEMGGLGNVMFEYAGTVGLAQANNRVLLVRPDCQLLQAFNIKYVMRSEDGYKNRTVVYETSYAKYDTKLENLPKGNIHLVAYLQSYKYFRNVADEIKKEFSFLSYIHSKAESIFRKFAQIMKTTVGVHVRRGDKLLMKDSSQGDLVPPVTYFLKAFRWMRRRHGNVTFLVATDDPAWCRGAFAAEPGVILLPENTREVHMCVLSLCHHVIMSVGTFGWWAGWLSGGQVIYYKHQVLEGSPRSRNFNLSDFVLPSWIGIGD